MRRLPSLPSLLAPALVSAALVLPGPARGTAEVPVVPVATETSGTPAEPATPPATAELPGTPDLRAIPGLEDVRVVRRGRVLVLEGSVGREADRELARRVAAAEPDVAEVLDRLVIDTDVGDRLRDWRADSLDRLGRLLAATPLLVVAALIVALFWWLGRRLSRGRWGPLQRKDANPFLAGLAAQAIQLVFVLVGLLIGLQLLDALALAGALIGSAGVVGIAVGFAFRDLAENYIASILLSLKQPFAPDDSVVIDGNEGIVVGLTSRATLLMTPDGNHLRLPNALVFKSVILNHTRNGRRRFFFEMRLAPEADIDAALREALAAVTSVPGMLENPAPFVQIGNADHDWLLLQVFGWVDQREANFGWCRSESIRRVRAALIAAGIAFRRPVQRWIECGEPEPVAATVEAPPPPPPKAEHHAVGEAVAEARRDMGEEDLLSAAAPRE
ncbi:mechanosensitive ion channel family protein [Arenimonas composti]|uniref:Small-conductance mechanosensitive channel n=1 Tax=Arenimonas composti TR7-09 = DSM 18010 TaxID=1121013 RepID=A0A091BHA7_9GAMM|nr:mechanosensitive ion channel domain-containing protein [Arenimonas composti]KFN50174.1 hypothetical protein P873_08015 [Arenimonas composti TR7-09 = DSM 18010]